MKPTFVWIEVCFLGVLMVLAAAGQEVAVEPETPTKAGPVVAPAQASVLRLIRFSGAVRDALGVPRTGVAGVTFALYAEREAGTPLWVETQSLTLDAQGRYTALLGITSNDGLPLEMFSTEEARWLGIQVQGEPEQARVLLVAVPYALKALDAETLGGKPLSAFVLAGPGEGAASGTETGEAPIEEPKAQVGGSGTTNMVAKFTAAETLGDSQIFDNGTNIGIGTTSPTNKLQVNGNIRLIGQTTHQVQVTGVASSGRLGQDVNGFFFASDTPGKLLSFFTNPAAPPGAGIQRRMTITDSGNVGIGTASPIGRLEALTSGDTGVRGVSSAFSGRGVVGFASSVEGNTIGVLGLTPSTGGIGVQGEATATTGLTMGVLGFSASVQGKGVVGEATNLSGATIGVFGRSHSPDGSGIVASNTGGGVALRAFSTTNVAGDFDRSDDLDTGVILQARNGSDVEFKVLGNGNVFADGAFTGGGADFAESVEVLGDRQEYEPGDVLVIDSTGKRRVGVAQAEYSPLVAGIYSTKPGLLGRQWEDEEADARLAQEIPMAIVGIVPCKVSAENGPIQTGDLLVTSSTPGHAMKGSDRGRMLGAILGKALEPLAGGSGVIQVLVTLQ